MTVLADFILLGHQKGALRSAQDEQSFLQWLLGHSWILSARRSTAGNPVPGWISTDNISPEVTDYQKMVHGDIEDADIAKVSAFIKDMTGTGVLVPDEGLEDYIRQIGHLPPRTEDVAEPVTERERQQNRNEPPEAASAAGEGISVDEKNGFPRSGSC